MNYIDGVIESVRCYKVAEMFGYDLDALVAHHSLGFPAATKLMLKVWIRREIESGKDPWLSPQPDITPLVRGSEHG